MMMKRYLEELLLLCSEHRFGQDAVEWAIWNQMVRPTYADLQADANAIMARYDEIILAYRGVLAQLEREAA